RVGLAVLDHAHRQADVVGGGGAGRDRGDVRAAGAGQARGLAGDQVDDGAGPVDRRPLARAAFLVLQRGFLDALEAADARADGDADALGRLAFDRDAGVGDRHQRRGHAVMHEGVHLLDVLRRDPLGRVETLDLAGDAGREAGGVEVGDRADAGTAVDDPVPAAAQVVAERRQDAEAGDGDATFWHGWLHSGGLQCKGPWFKCTGPRTRPRQLDRNVGGLRLDVGLDVVDGLLHRGDLL